MASDYANRARKPRGPAKKGGKGGKGRKGGSERNLTGLILMVGAALAALIVVGILILKKDQQPVAAPPVAPAKGAKPLPDKPTEEWSYIEELENKKVEVTVPDAPSSGPYQLQCGSFRQRDQAESMRAKIAFQGLESTIRSSEGSNGLWYKVVLGPFDTKREAQKHMHTLSRAQVTTCQVWKWTKS